MTLIQTTGCISDSLRVDDVEEIDLKDRKRIDALKRIGKYISGLDLDDEALDRLRERMLGYLDLEEKEVEGKNACELGTIIKNLHPDKLNYLLQFVISDFGKVTYHSNEPCECCGDYIWEYTLEV